MQTIDSLLNAKWIIPVEPHDYYMENASLAIKDGIILEVLPQAEARQKYRAAVTHHLPDHALVPGFVNSHTHAAMTLFRGLADDLPLMEWLEKHIWPAEAAWVNPEFINTGTTLAVAEMLSSGTTCFNDMYFYPEETARVVDAIGIRATLGLIVLGFPTVWAKDAAEYLHKGLAVHDQYRHHHLIKTAFAPHAPYTVPDEPLHKIATLAEELDIPIHMHVHETQSEVQDARQSTGKSPIQRLMEIGLLSPRMMAVHMTAVESDDLQRLKDSGAHVIHCPESNLKLASGFCQVSKFAHAGINVALGTDGAASNNDLDMFGEMRCAALLAKVLTKNASSLPAADALRMATLNGAKALGRDTEIGSLVPGKAADVIAIDLNHIATQPVYHPISQIVYAASRDQVTDVWVAGRHLLKNRVHTTLDCNEIIAKAQAWADKIKDTPVE